MHRAHAHVHETYTHNVHVNHTSDDDRYVHPLYTMIIHDDYTRLLYTIVHHYTPFSNQLYADHPVLYNHQYTPSIDIIAPFYANHTRLYTIIHYICRLYAIIRFHHLYTVVHHFTPLSDIIHHFSHFVHHGYTLLYSIIRRNTQRPLIQVGLRHMASSSDGEHF